VRTLSPPRAASRYFRSSSRRSANFSGRSSWGVVNTAMHPVRRFHLPRADVAFVVAWDRNVDLVYHRVSRHRVRMGAPGVNVVGTL